MKVFFSYKFSLSLLASLGVFSMTTGVIAEPLPKGRYQGSCRNCTMNQGNLHCECSEYGTMQRMMDPVTWKNSTLQQAKKCSAGIVNCGGNLTCGSC